MPEFERQVARVLWELSVRANTKGYAFLREAILLTLRDMSLVNAVTKRLYPEIARRFGTTASCVERDIRHAVAAAWERSESETRRRYFGPSPLKPANAEFIAMIADSLTLRQKQARR